MRTETIERSAFIELLSNFTFYVYFHEEKYPKGKVIWNDKDGTWGFDETKDYWNFLIQINSHHTDYVIENWYKNDYREFLENCLKDYVKQNEISYLSSLSHSECFDLINQEIVKLDDINNQFYTKIFIDEDNAGMSYELLWHRKICFETPNDEDLRNENGNRFFNEQISFYVSRQKEVIEFAINFLNKKLQWLELHNKKEVNYENHQSLEDESAKITTNYSNISITGRRKYFSYDVDKLKLVDENSDYMRCVLLDNKAIEDVDYRDFRRLFKNELLTKPIVWILKDSVLYYFIKTLVDKQVIIDHNNHWKITSICFVIKEKGITRRIYSNRIARLKPPMKGIDYKKFNKVFSFIKS